MDLRNGRGASSDVPLTFLMVGGTGIERKRTGLAVLTA